MGKEFIKKAGAIEILYELENGEKTFGELRKLSISSGTLSKRLKEGIELGLIKQETRREEGSLKPKVTYKLSEDVRELIKSIEHIWREYSKIREEIRRFKEEIRKREKDLEKMLEEV